MKKVKVSESEGQVLNYLVAKCIHEPDDVVICEGRVFAYDDATCGFNPSTDWAQGGPIIERGEIALEPMTHDKFGDGWLATRVEGPAVCMEFGPTMLIAAMRCYVVGILGDEVEVPDELKGVE